MLSARRALLVRLLENIFLGAVLGRSGSCHLSYPGGCELGPRPIDMHLDALRQMGAHFSVHGYF